MLHGRWGPYITDGEKNARVPKDVEAEALTRDAAVELLAKAPARKGRGGRKPAAGKSKAAAKPKAAAGKAKAKAKSPAKKTTAGAKRKSAASS